MKDRGRRPPFVVSSTSQQGDENTSILESLNHSAHGNFKTYCEGQNMTAMEHTSI